MDTGKLEGELPVSFSPFSPDAPLACGLWVASWRGSLSAPAQGERKALLTTKNRPGPGQRPPSRTAAIPNGRSLQGRVSQDLCQL